MLQTMNMTRRTSCGGDLQPKGMPGFCEWKWRWSGITGLILVTLTLCLAPCARAVRVEEQRLMDSLLADYNNAARPVFRASHTVTVKFGLTLTQISDVDEVNQVLTINVWLEQEWEDERLVWDHEKYNGLKILRIPCEKIWLPDIVLYNSADDFTTGYMKSKAMVTYTGNVFWPPPAKFRSSCKIDITYFPFDDQVCELKFGSWTYDGFQVDITNRSAKVDLTNYVFSGEWELIDVRIRRTEMYYACCEEPYPDVRFTIIIRRKTLYYLFNIIFPCLWLTILSLLGFWLPPDSGEKITLGITVLLSFSVFMLLIAESMPATSEFVPLIGIYLTVTMAMTSLSIILTVFVLQLHHVGPHQRRVPTWLWTVVVDVLAPLMCLCHISQRYRHLGTKPVRHPHQSPTSGSAQPSNKASVLNHSLNTVVTSLPHTRGSNRGEAIRMNTINRDCDLSGEGGTVNCNGVVVARDVDCPAVIDEPRNVGHKQSRHHAGNGRDGPCGGARLCHSSKGPSSGFFVAVASSQSAPLPSCPPESHHDVIADGFSQLDATRVTRTLVSEDHGPVWVKSSTQEFNYPDSHLRPEYTVQDEAVRNQESVYTDTMAQSGLRCDIRVSPPVCDRQHRYNPQNTGLRVQTDKGEERKGEYCAPPSVTAQRANNHQASNNNNPTQHEHRAFNGKQSSRVRNDTGPTKDKVETVICGPGAGAGSGAGSGVCSRTANKHDQPKTSDKDKASTTFQVAGEVYHATYGGAARRGKPVSPPVTRHYQPPARDSGSQHNDRITQHLEVLVSGQDKADNQHQDIVTEWRVVAHVMDRLLFWLFLFVAVVSSVLILVVKPLTKPESWRHES